MKRSLTSNRPLASLPPFSGCTPRQLRQLAQLTCEVRVPAGTVLATQGRRAVQYVVIVDGTADEKLDGRRVATLEPGDDLGGMGLVDDVPHPSSICAATPMVLQVVGPREFRAAYATNPALRTHVDDEAVRVARRWNLAGVPTPATPHAHQPFGYTLVS